MFKYWGSNKQLKSNEAVWKQATDILYYVKQRCLLVQVAGYKNQNVKVSAFKNFLNSSKDLQNQNDYWCYMSM